MRERGVVLRLESGGEVSFFCECSAFVYPWLPVEDLVERGNYLPASEFINSATFPEESGVNTKGNVEVGFFEFTRRMSPVVMGDYPSRMKQAASMKEILLAALRKEGFRPASLRELLCSCKIRLPLTQTHRVVALGSCWEGDPWELETEPMVAAIDVTIESVEETHATVVRQRLKRLVLLQETNLFYFPNQCVRTFFAGVRE